MDTKLATIDKDLASIDFQRLIEYEKLIEKIATMSKMEAPSYLRDFIMAADLASQGLSTAIQLNMKAKAVLETYKSIAYLDKAGPFLAAKGIKDGAGSREQYIDLDSEVIQAKDIYAKSEAIVSLLKGKVSMFTNCHHDCKKIAYSETDKLGFEGM